MADPTLDLIARLQSMQGNSDMPGSFMGLLPNADVSGGLQLIVVGGVLKGSLNTPIAALAQGGRFGVKQGKQALIAKIGAQISADFQKANQEGQAYKQMLAADVQQAAISHGLPKDLGTGGSGGSRSV